MLVLVLSLWDLVLGAFGRGGGTGWDICAMHGADRRSGELRENWRFTTAAILYHSRLAARHDRKAALWRSRSVNSGSSDGRFWQVCFRIFRRLRTQLIVLITVRALVPFQSRQDVEWIGVRFVGARRSYHSLGLRLLDPE